jgi:hypothetical protein
MGPNPRSHALPVASISRSCQKRGTLLALAAVLAAVPSVVHVEARTPVLCTPPPDVRTDDHAHDQQRPQIRRCHVGSSPLSFVLLAIMTASASHGIGGIRSRASLAGDQHPTRSRSGGPRCCARCRRGYQQEARWQTGRREHASTHAADAPAPRASCDACPVYGGTTSVHREVRTAPAVASPPPDQFVPATSAAHRAQQRAQFAVAQAARRAGQRERNHPCCAMSRGAVIRRGVRCGPVPPNRSRACRAGPARAPGRSPCRAAGRCCRRRSRSRRRGRTAW